MTNKEFLNRLIRLEQDKKRQISKIEEKFDADKEKLFESYAKANARFKSGDVIMQRHPEYGPVGFTIIRVESMRTINEGTSVYLSYYGRELNSDFTESYSTTWMPRYETIWDRAEDTVLLPKPLHTSFVIVTSTGREIPAKTCREAIEAARTVLTTTYEDIVRYGVTDSGEREEIQAISNARKYFERH